MAIGSESVARHAVEALLGAGADHAQCRYSETDKHELNAELNEPSLLRSTFDRGLELTAILEGKKASLRVNETTEAAIARAASSLVELARASRADPANAIAEAQPPASFDTGPEAPDLGALHTRLEEFLHHRAANCPQTTLRDAHFDFTRTATAIANSNGVALEGRSGVYTFSAIFSARQGADVSSFNYTATQSRSIDTPVAELGSFQRLMRQTGEQTRAGRMPGLDHGGKFVGDVIVTPDCLGSFVSPMARYLGDEALVSGTSVYRDRLGERVADASLTLRSNPRADHAAAPCFFTRDGYVTEDATIVSGGVLRMFLTSDYGARKTGHPRASTDGEHWEVDPGDASFEALVGGVERGVLLCRFSGGRPSDAGDFSGVAKNSYAILDGKVGPPLSETMVSGNLVLLLEQIGVSRERVDFGYARYPWVRLQGVTIS